MKSQDVQCVVAMVPNYWSKAKTVADADAQLKRAGYRKPSAEWIRAHKGGARAVYFLVTCAPEDAKVIDMGIGISVVAPEGATMLKLTENW